MRAQADVTDPIWRRYAADRREAWLRDWLVARHIWVADAILSKVCAHLPRHIDRDPLQSAAYEALVWCVERFDPGHSVGFSTFAWPRIRGAAYDALREMDHASRLRRQRDKERQRLEQTWLADRGRPPRDEEIAAETGWTAEQIAASRVPALCSIEEEHDGSETILRDVLADPHTAGDPEHAAYFFGRVARGLGIEQQIVLYLCYFKGKTLSEIGGALELSESRISQMRVEALQRLRAMRTRAELVEEL